MMPWRLRPSRCTSRDTSPLRPLGLEVLFFPVYRSPRLAASDGHARYPATGEVPSPPMLIPPVRSHARFILGILTTLAVLTLVAGVLTFRPSWGSPERAPPELIWGRRGLSAGRFQKPRALAIDSLDQLYIVDMTARIQVFDRDGHPLRAWRTPAWTQGRPTGLSFDRHGHLMVADTHYHRILFYTPKGEPLPEKTLGGEYGSGPGQFGLVTDAEEDSQGNLYVSEYGDFDRIQKFDSHGKFLVQWGGHGSEPGKFLRPQNISLDDQDQLWVADACNHRVQVFDVRQMPPTLVRCWGDEGTGPGQLRYPYDLNLVEPDLVYVCEFGNHRIQVFDREGHFLTQWGQSGRGPGELNAPWALEIDRGGSVHVLDSLNHRVQRVRIPIPRPK